jgi:hypothetical protein
MKKFFSIVFWLFVLSSISFTAYKTLNVNCNEIPINNDAKEAETNEYEGGKVSNVKKAIKSINNFVESKLNRCS